METAAADEWARIKGLRRLLEASRPHPAQAGIEAQLRGGEYVSECPLSTHCGHYDRRYPRRMSAEPERVNTSEALNLIRKYADDGVQILGLDGFVVAPGGFYASLDLLLDVSSRDLTVAQAAAESEAFVKSKAAPDVVWEVWARAP